MAEPRATTKAGMEGRRHTQNEAPRRHDIIVSLGGKPDPRLAARPDLEAAMERAMTLSHADYVSRVVSYLHPDHQASLGSTESWDAIQLKVVEYLDQALLVGRGPGR